jgi:hypothetical protein
VARRREQSLVRKPSQYFVDAVEASELLLLDPPSHQRIVDGVPGYSAAQRVGLQRHAAAKDQRIVNSLSTSAEERYEEFLRTYPSIAVRVPQWMLASYLGVSPETLSHVRKEGVKPGCEPLRVLFAGLNRRRHCHWPPPVREIVSSGQD